MIKLAIFDIDGTLAPAGKPVAQDDLALVKELERKGVRIALCSGKPVYYQCGFARMMGLEEPIFIGEVGGEVQFGVELPPSEVKRMTYPEKTRRALEKTESDLRAMYGDRLWFEDKHVIVSAFPRTKDGFTLIEDYISSHTELLQGVKIYRYSDCVDFAPVEVNKGVGIRYVCEKLGVSLEETVTFGDSANDYPMFEISGDSYGINIADKTKANHVVSSLNEALHAVLRSV